MNLPTELNYSRTPYEKVVISAAKYYMGVPDGCFFSKAHFDESVANAKKAYVTLNTLMGGDSAEEDRFQEGKKQLPGMFDIYGVYEMTRLFKYLFIGASRMSVDISLETVRACRQSEVTEGECIAKALTSTTKLSAEKIMELGYGDKNGLAICKYKFHEGAVAFDMENLGDDYLKPEEREVLILMGNKLITRYRGEDSRYQGKDGQPAKIYEVDVYQPSLVMADNEWILNNEVFNEEKLSEIKQFFEKLNTSKEFPEMPECYPKWKESFQKLVFHVLAKAEMEIKE